ncbi:MAG TPA: c-type cytochrome [Burkholderiales bacterium]|nr:c-type cytochrome [Burkholderiales bacterium]
MLRKVWLAALALAITPAAAQTPLERGKYLVEGILTCGNCHTPRGPGGVLDTARRHAGGPQVWETAEYRVYPSNVTPDTATGIGSWSAAQVKAAIRDGKRPSGQQLSPQMPSAYYKIFAPADLDAVVAYMQSLPPVPRKVEPPVYKVKRMSVDVPPGAEKPLPDAAMKDPVKRGFYLVTIGHCMECHTPIVNGHRDFKNALGTGGERFEGPWGVSTSRNITAHKGNGIGAWTDDEVKRAITQGVRKDGTKLRPPMGYDWYATMTQADLNAIVAYVRTIPAR